MTEMSISEEKKKKPAKKQSKKPVILNEPCKNYQQNNHMVEPEESNNYHFSGLVPNEIKGGLTNTALYALSMPAGQNKQRLMYNLHQSSYVSMYLKKYLCIDQVSLIDDHSKFLLVYVMNFVDAFMSGRQVAQQQPMPAPTTVEQEIKNL